MLPLIIIAVFFLVVIEDIFYQIEQQLKHTTRNYIFVCMFFVAVLVWYLRVPLSSWVGTAKQSRVEKVNRRIALSGYMRKRKAEELLKLEKEHAQLQNELEEEEEELKMASEGAATWFKYKIGVIPSKRKPWVVEEN
jgi:cytochrome c biogenesis protein ResB